VNKKFITSSLIRLVSTFSFNQECCKLWHADNWAISTMHYTLCIVDYGTVSKIDQLKVNYNQWVFVTCHAVQFRPTAMIQFVVETCFKRSLSHDQLCLVPVTPVLLGPIHWTGKKRLRTGQGNNNRSTNSMQRFKNKPVTSNNNHNPWYTTSLCRMCYGYGRRKQALVWW